MNDHTLIRATLVTAVLGILAAHWNVDPEAFAVIKVSNGFICDTGGLYYDWDDDGISNWWEARFSRSGSKTGLNASEDDDSDGMSDDY